MSIEEALRGANVPLSPEVITKLREDRYMLLPLPLSMGGRIKQGTYQTDEGEVYVYLLRDTLRLKDLPYIEQYMPFPALKAQLWVTDFMHDYEREELNKKGENYEVVILKIFLIS